MELFCHYINEDQLYRGDAMATRDLGLRAERGVTGRREWGCDLVFAVSVTARDLRLQSRFRPEIELA